MVNHITIDVLQLTHDARSTHGLRDDDYERYRISRSKKALGIQQDLKSQSLKIETTPTIQSAKHYEVILFQAERAWSYGMQFKTSILKVQKHHSMKRLSRAVFYSKCLSDQTKLLDFDVASTIQINAYHENMVGILTLESLNYAEAMQFFAHARVLYSGLAIHASLESQRLLATSVLELVDTNLRFCVYNNQKVNKSSSLNLKEVLKSSESKYADDLKELETRYKESLSEICEKDVVTKSIETKKKRKLRLLEERNSKPIMCVAFKPILFDIANNYIEYPIELLRKQL